MLTVSEKINIAKISQPYAAVDILRKGYAGGGVDLRLALKIYTVRKSVEWRASMEDDAGYTSYSAGLIKTSNFLYSLCGYYGLGSFDSGGSVAPIVPITPDIYPFFISSSDFESDGVTYINENIVGDNIALFVNQWTQQWWPPEAGFFVLTSNGFRVIVDGFNANEQNYTIMVQRVYSPTTPVTTDNTLQIDSSFSLLIDSDNQLLIN